MSTVFPSSVTTPTVISPTGISSLGCLYNVLANEYADKDCVGQCVVEGIHDTQTEIITVTNDVSYEIPSNITSIPYNEVEVSILVEESLIEVSNSLSLSAGIDEDYGAFSSSVSASYDYDSTKTDEKWFALVYDGKETMQASFSKEDLSNNLSLTSSFKRDLNDKNYNAEQFLKDYGTHLISGIKIGGQIRYSCSAEYKNYTSSQSFSVDVKAKYSSACNSTAFDGQYSTDTSSTSNYISAERNISIYGGSSDGQSDVRGGDGSYDTWLDSVALNPEFIGFSNKGLIPVWELCDDRNGSRAKALKAAYECYFGYTLKTEGSQFISGDDGHNSSSITGMNHNNYAAYTTGYKYGKGWMADPKKESTSIIIGFGATVNKNCYLDRILVKTLDMKSGSYNYHAVGNGTNNPDEYEKWYEVPEGSVMTGIALREKSKNLNNMVIYYQEIDTTSITGTTGYLKRNREVHWEGGALSEYEVAHIPKETGNTRVLTGIFVDCSKKKGGFDCLILQTAELALDLT